jgi:hypothetical protein
MPFKHKIEKFYPGFQLFEIGQDRILAAQPDVKALLAQGRKRLCDSLKIKPIGLGSFRMEENKGVASAGQLVPDFKITPDTPEDFNVRKNCCNLHLKIKVLFYQNSKFNRRKIEENVLASMKIGLRINFKNKNR